MAQGRLIHVLGGGPFQLPTIRAAKALGHRVLVTDMYSRRPGYELADAHEAIDVADRDATLEAAQRHAIDAILCDSVDVGVPTAAYVAEKLGLPGMGYGTALRFTRKNLMRKALAEAGVQQTRFCVVTGPAEASGAAEEIGYPVIVKPTDSQGSRGVHRVFDGEGLAAAFSDAMRWSRSGALLVEELFLGTEVIVDSVCFGGEAIVLGIADKDHFPVRPTARRITYPADIGAEARRRLIQLNRDAIQALGLRYGFAHGEYMVHGDDVRLIEIGARGGGSGIFTHVIPYLTGIDAARMSLEFALGSAGRPPIEAGERAANLHFFTFPRGRILEIVGLDRARALPGVMDIVLTLQPGDDIELPRDDSERPGPAIVVGATRSEVLERSRHVAELVRVIVG